MKGSRGVCSDGVGPKWLLTLSFKAKDILSSLKILWKGLNWALLKILLGLPKSHIALHCLESLIPIMAS